MKNIDHISWDQDHITTQSGYIMQSINLLGGEKTAVRIDPLISLTPHGGLAYSPEQKRYVFYRLHRTAESSWVHKTVHLLDSSPGAPSLAHVSQDALYLLDEDGRFFAHRAWQQDHRAPWQAIDLQFKHSKAVMSPAGDFFFIREKDGLLFSKGLWRKSVRLTSYPVKGALSFAGEILFLTDRGLEDRSGRVIWAGKIQDIANSKNFLALLTEEAICLLDRDERIIEKDLTFPFDRLLIHEDDLLLVESKSGHGLLRRISSLFI